MVKLSEIIYIDLSLLTSTYISEYAKIRLRNYLYVKSLLSSPKFISLALVLIALIAVPLTLIQVQHQQNLKQEASTSSYSTSQSASLVCGANGFDINVSIKNSSSSYYSYSTTTINVTAKDNQTGVTINLGTVQSGKTVTGIIHTKKSALNSSSVTFLLSKPDSYNDTSSKTASYQAGNNSNGGYGYGGYSSGSATCSPQATPTPTPPPYNAPTPTPTPYPYGVPTPTPTICPTLGPVSNVHIDCPNCTKQY